MKLKRFFALMLALALSLTMLQGVAFGATVGSVIDVTGATINGNPITMKVKVTSVSPLEVQVFGDTSKVQTAIDDATTGALTIPSSVSDGTNTYTVTSIGSGAFYYCENLAAITIPAGVTSIGENAFWKCTSLASFTIGADSKLDAIGVNAFYYCINLTAINIPASVTSIGMGAFTDCRSLGSVIFENGSKLETISVNAFLTCNDLATIDLPEGLRTIEGWAFKGTALTSITIPASAQTMGEGVFDDTPITTITFAGSNLGSINQYAFGGAVRNLNFAGVYENQKSDDMLSELYSSLKSTFGSRTYTIQYNQNYSGWETALNATGFKFSDISPYEPDPTTNPDPGNGSGSAGGSGGTGSSTGGAWYIGTLNTNGGSSAGGSAGGSTFVPTYTQISDEQSTTQMLQAGNTITVIGGSPTGVIVKLDPTALAGKQSLSIENSIANMQLTAEQIASLIAQAGNNTIHITIKQTADGNIISILAGGRTITL